MPPQEQAGSRVFIETDVQTKDLGLKDKPASQADSRPLDIVWRNVILFIFLHLAAVYGAYTLVTKAMWTTCLFTIVLVIASGLGITAGAHRLWSHKSYKARLPLRIILAFFNTIAFQDSVISWSRDHRMHHKYSETDADPHNATRGFFFSHVGWLLVRKHPAIKEKGHNVDMSDLRSDPVLRFQDKYYVPLMVTACFVMPTLVPTLWGESLWNSFFVCAMFRYAYCLNITWLVNSAAHKWGDKPYDKNISPVETKPISFLVLGEGFHNYHHTFPWDYKTAELGNYSLNVTKLFIDTMSIIGWAYDLKTVCKEIVRQRASRTGDGSHHVWGWDDKEVSQEDRKEAKIINPDKDE